LAGLHERISTRWPRDTWFRGWNQLKLCDAGNFPDRRVEDRTDKVMSCAVAITMTKSKQPELDLDAEAQAALDEARAMPQGPERTAAMKKAGIQRNAADSHGIVYAKRGRPTKT